MLKVSAKDRRKACDAIVDVSNELWCAMKVYPKFASPHEGAAILREEFDELWEIVRLKPQNRSTIRMRSEAKQIAAMAIRFMVDLT